MSTSHRIGRIVVDEERAAADLAQAEPGGFLPAYDEFVCGSWRTCMLANAHGDSDDTRIHDYSGGAQPTEYGRRLSYVQELLQANFDLDELRFARLARLGPGSVVVPHRDFLDFDSNLTRIHVPLETDPACFTSQESTIYRMGIGEIWSIDASRPHSIANFSEGNRTHLLLDFATDWASAVVAPADPTPSIPDDATVPRRQLRPGEREAFMRLAEIADPLNLRDILAMLIKRYYLADIEITDVFTWMGEIAAASGDDAVVEQSRRLEQHSLVAG